MKDIAKIIDKVFILDEMQRHFFDHVSYAIIVLDKEGLIYMVNDKFLHQLGYVLNDVIGKSWMDFCHPDDLQRSIDIASKNLPYETFLDGIPYFENRYRTKSGDYKTLRWHEGDALFFNNMYIAYAKIL